MEVKNNDHNLSVDLIRKRIRIPIGQLQNLVLVTKKQDIPKISIFQMHFTSRQCHNNKLIRIMEISLLLYFANI